MYTQHIQVKYTSFFFLQHISWPILCISVRFCRTKQNSSLRSRDRWTHGWNQGMFVLKSGWLNQQLCGRERKRKISRLISQNHRCPKFQASHLLWRLFLFTSAGVLPLEVQSRIANVAAWYITEVRFILRWYIIKWVTCYKKTESKNGHLDESKTGQSSLKPQFLGEICVWNGLRFPIWSPLR